MFAGNQFTLLKRKFTDCCLHHALKFLVVGKEKGSRQLCLIRFWIIILHRTSEELFFSIVNGKCSRCGQVPEHHLMHQRMCTRVSTNFAFLCSSLLRDLETDFFECPFGDFKNKNSDKFRVCQISFNYSGM
jgi:hypothetical protein